MEVFVNDKDVEGWTALHYACQNDNLEIAKRLLNMKADANSVDLQGVTPMMLSVTQNSSNRREMLVLLTQHVSPILVAIELLNRGHLIGKL